MNLTPKDWNMQSELTHTSVKVGDIISYSDVCNFNRYRIIEVDEIEMIIESIDNPGWQDVKTFEQLNNRWEFCLTSKGEFCS